MSPPKVLQQLEQKMPLRAAVEVFRKPETFARKMILPSGKAKTHGMTRVLERSALITEFMFINDRLSAFLTQHEGEMAFVQRSQPLPPPFLAEANAFQSSYLTGSPLSRG